MSDVRPVEHRDASRGLPAAYGRCSCGWRVTRMFGARRAVARHVREEVELEALRAQTRAALSPDH